LAYERRRSRPREKRKVFLTVAFLLALYRGRAPVFNALSKTFACEATSKVFVTFCARRLLKATVRTRWPGDLPGQRFYAG
jgi:hypothetical protein